MNCDSPPLPPKPKVVAQHPALKSSPELDRTNKLGNKKSEGYNFWNVVNGTSNLYQNLEGIPSCSSSAEKQSSNSYINTETNLVRSAAASTTSESFNGGRSADSRMPDHSFQNHFSSTNPFSYVNVNHNLSSEASSTASSSSTLPTTAPTLPPRAAPPLLTLAVNATLNVNVSPQANDLTQHFDNSASEANPNQGGHWQWIPSNPLTVNLETSKSTFSDNLKKLNSSGYYFGKMSSSQSDSLLREKAPGTFLIRDSNHDNCLYALSIQRDRSEGPTSIRIMSEGLKFRLDATNELARRAMPRFDSVIDLVEYYINHKAGGNHAATTTTSQGQKTTWVDSDEVESHVQLRHPLYKTANGAPSLSHQCRKAILKAIKHTGQLNVSRSNSEIKTLQAVSQLKLPPRLSEYLKEYPHAV